MYYTFVVVVAFFVFIICGERRIKREKSEIRTSVFASISDYIPALKLLYLLKPFLFGVNDTISIKFLVYYYYQILVSE